MKYDLIVCGAGPAGAMAAATAAAAGAKVLLLEREKLPRYKTCGGGMPMVVGDLLSGLAPGAFVEAEVRAMRHTWNFERAFLAPINPPGAERDITLWMVRRSRFDHALVERAVRAGAELRDELAVRSVEADRNGVTVRVAGKSEATALTATAPRLIGADGANGITARAADLRRNRSVAVAVEVEHPHAWGEGHPDLRPEVLHLEYGAVPRGYAWAFPKGDHLSVGAGIFQPDRVADRLPNGAGPLLKETVYRYLDSLQVPYARDAIRFHAHPIPIWNGKERLHTRDGRILLAGDAAGLVNPLFGDGIFHAVRSGIIAGECVVQGATKEYSRRIHATFASTFTAAARIASLLYDWEEWLYEKAVCRPRATHLAASILCGEPLTPSLVGFLMGRLRSVLREARQQDAPRPA